MLSIRSIQSISISREAFISHSDGLGVRVVQGTGVRIERVGDVLSFTLTNAARGNEVTGPMFDAMLASLHEEARSPLARVLRLRADGVQFCVGRERSAREPEAIRQEIRRLLELKRALRLSPLLTVAEVQGDALGFGFGLAICCDFVLAAESAMFGFPEMLFGLPPMAIMSYLNEYALPRHLFPLVLLGEPISAERALHVGLLNDVVPAANLAERADALVAKLLALDASAMRNCKEFFRTTLGGTFEENARLALDALTVASLELQSKRT